MYYAFTLDFDTLQRNAMKTAPLPSRLTYSVASSLMLVLVLLLILMGVLPSPL